MKTSKKNKKLTLAIILVGSITLVGSISAFAHQNFGGGNFVGRNYSAGCQANIDEKTIETRNKLLSETTQIRKQLTITQTELRALMSSENPDSKVVGRLAGEIFDLQEQLRNKVEESGVRGIGHMIMGVNHHLGNKYFGYGRGPWSDN